jgi:hypothetical protein
MIVNLSGLNHLVVDSWALHQVKGRKTETVGVVGRCIRNDNFGQSMPIHAIDPVNHMVITESGSIYKLGTPNPEFAVANPELMIELGLQQLQSA